MEEKLPNTVPAKTQSGKRLKADTVNKIIDALPQRVTMRATKTRLNTTVLPNGMYDYQVLLWNNTAQEWQVSWLRFHA